jgi:putative tryptophan/tyrosine transport system substrate-binding protein
VIDHAAIETPTNVIVRLLLIVFVTCVARVGAWAADDSTKIYRIGLLESMSASDAEVTRLREELWHGLRDLGYIRRKNLIVETVYSEGRSERFPDLVKELLARKVDLIVVTTTPAGLAAKAATNTVPILFPMAIDPVGTGLVSTLSRPGGNATGISMVSVELSGKRLELLKELNPRLSQLGVLLNPTNAGNARILSHTEEAARQLGIGVKPHAVRSLEDVPSALAAIARQRLDALLVLPDPLTFDRREEICRFARDARLPVSNASKEWVSAGCLMSCGADYGEAWRRSAVYADKILKGANPGDIPVEQVSNFGLVINMKTARAVRLKIPPSLLVQARQTVE